MKKTPSHRKYPQALAATLLGAMLASNSAHAVNAGWNTDASTGNFNTAQWTSGVTVPAAGGTYTVVSGDALYFGTSTTTTLSNDLTGATYAGLTFNSGASAYTIGGNAFTLSGGITNSSGSLQTINNAISLSTATHAITATSGNITLGGAFSGATGSVTFSGPGTTTLSGTNAFNLNQGNFGAFTVGASAAAPGFVSITGATTLSSTGTGSTSGGSLVIQGTSTLTIQTGGSLAVNAVSGTAGSSIIGQNATGTSTLLVNGGSLTVSGAQGFVIGNSNGTTTGAIGVLTISSGTATINRGTLGGAATGDQRLIEMGRDRSDASGTINLNGGILATDRQFVRDGSSGNAAAGTANFVFGGGTLKALGTQTDWLQSTTATSGGQGGGTVNASALALSSVTTTSANSTIDANSFSVAINNSITGVGGFHIIDSSVAGTGIVHFGGASYAYAGATSVDSGTFNTNRASVAFSGNLAVAGGKFTVNGIGAGSVSTAGFSMSSGTWTVSIGDTISTSGNMSITGGTLDVAAFSGSEATYSSTGYTLVTSIGGTGSVSNLSITGYDTTNYTASLSDAGVLTFAAIPEPSTYAALAGVLALGTVITRRRNR